MDDNQAPLIHPLAPEDDPLHRQALAKAFHTMTGRDPKILSVAEISTISEAFHATHIKPFGRDEAILALEMKCDQLRLQLTEYINSKSSEPLSYSPLRLCWSLLIYAIRRSPLYRKLASIKTSVSKLLS